MAHETGDQLLKAYVRKGRGGWWRAVTRWLGSDGSQGISVIAPLSREDALLCRESAQQFYRQKQRGKP